MFPCIENKSQQLGWKPLICFLAGNVSEQEVKRQEVHALRTTGPWGPLSWKRLEASL